MIEKGGMEGDREIEEETRKGKRLILHVLLRVEKNLQITSTRELSSYLINIYFHIYKKSSFR